MEEYNGIGANDKCAFWFSLMMDADLEVFMHLLDKAAKRRWPTPDSSVREGSCSTES